MSDVMIDPTEVGGERSTAEPWDFADMDYQRDDIDEVDAMARA